MVCSLLILILFSFFRPFFSTNDDCFKILFAKGIGTNLQPSEFIGYSSIPLGFILKGLYGSFPTFPWYGSCLLLAQFLGIWLLLYSLYLGSSPLWKSLLFIISFLAADVTFFSSLQFTISASLAAQGGLFLFAKILDGEKSPGVTGNLSLVLASWLLAALIRFDELLVTVFCAAPFILYFLRGNIIRLLTPPIVQFILTTVLFLLGISLFTFYWHEHKPGWHEFDLFDHERVEFRDYRIHFYTPSTKPFFDEADWSENDFKMFKGWYFMDPDRYDWKNIQRLKLHFSRFGVEDKDSSFHSLWEIIRSDFGTRLLPILLCLLLILSRIEFRWMIFSVVWIILFILYMLYFWRAPDRLVFQELYYLLCLSISWAENPIAPSTPAIHAYSNWISRTGLFFLILFTCTSIPTLQRDYTINQLNIGLENQLKSDIARLNPKDDQLFIIWDSAFPYELIDAFDSYEIFRNFHIFELAVYQRSPDAIPQLKKFGLVNPLVDMIGKSNVFFICKPEELRMYGRYLSENHPQKILASRYFEGQSFKVFQILPWKEAIPNPKN